MTAQYGLLGRTLKHSFSVPIHRALGNNAYELIELEPDELSDFFSGRNIGGLNVTIPYKQTVLPYCAVHAPEVQRIGSCNTIVNRNGVLHAHNTDLYGFMYMLRAAGLNPKNKKVLVLGSGGASKAAVAGLQDLGAKDIVVISRRGSHRYDNIQIHRNADMIVNATPVGMYPNCPEAPVSLRLFPHCSGVADMIYNPLRTALLWEAEQLGIPHTGGLSMLVAQAKVAHDLFFTTNAPDARIEDIRRKLEAEAANIVLIGMPGSGKTSIGTRLAALSGRLCIDTDAEIERDAGCSIPEIFTRYGEPYFRTLEHTVCERIGKMSGVIITCGGGIVTRADNYPLLHQNGRLYHITRALDDLPLDGRPLSTDRSGLAAMAAKRLPLYEQFADVTVDNDGTLDAIVNTIWRDFLAHLGD